MTTWHAMSRESIRAARGAMSDGCYRNSTSRAYYAAYAAVAQVLADKGLEFAGDRLGPAHQKVREMIQMNLGQLKPRGLRRMRAADKRRLAAALNLLYDQRLTADYRPDRTIDEAEARNSLVAATRVCGLLGVTP